MELINLSYKRKKELRDYCKQLISDEFEANNLIKLPKNILETLIYNQKNELAKVLIKK